MMGRYGYGFGHPTGWGVGFGIVELLIQVAVWAAIIYGLVMLVRHLQTNKIGSDPESMEILKRRYAKGEINKKEFEEMKKDMT